MSLKQAEFVKDLLRDVRDEEVSKVTILVNLGTPDQPYEKEVRTYLKEFLSDKHVIRLPRLFWLTLLNLVILRTRPKKKC